MSSSASGEHSSARAVTLRILEQSLGGRAGGDANPGPCRENPIEDGKFSVTPICGNCAKAGECPKAGSAGRRNGNASIDGTTMFDTFLFSELPTEQHFLEWLGQPCLG